MGEGIIRVAPLTLYDTRSVDFFFWGFLVRLASRIEPAFPRQVNFDAGCSRCPTVFGLLSLLGMITLAEQVVHNGYVTSGVGIAVGTRKGFAAVQQVLITLDHGVLRPIRMSPV